MTPKSAAETLSAPTFSIDRPNQLLWRGDTPTKVPPKVFQLLSYLRDNPGRIIEYDELLDAVWPREFVQPEILKTYVKTIRRLLEDDAHAPHFIETRARCGYSFIGQLPDRAERADRASPAPSRLIGRDDALATLQAALRSTDGGQRRVMFVVGEAGIGKTRLLDEFLARAAPSDAAVLRAIAPRHSIRRTAFHRCASSRVSCRSAAAASLATRAGASQQRAAAIPNGCAAMSRRWRPSTRRSWWSRTCNGPTSR
ncbi:winged helix-turn-helix domain-containing protein [Roseateles sp. GG27B]